MSDPIAFRQRFIVFLDSGRHVDGELNLAVLEKLADRKANVFCDLAQQNRRDVTTLMKRYRRTTAITMSKLLM